MEKPDSTTEAVARQLEELVARTGASQRVGLDLMAQRQQRRVERKRAVAERLTAALQREDPRRAVVEKSISGGSELEMLIRQRSTRLQNLPSAGADNWIVAGNIRYDDGRPATGVVVSVRDGQNELGDRLGTARANEFGDFALVNNALRLQTEFGDKLPDLFVTVSDEEGNQLALSREPLQCVAGRTDHVDIQVVRDAGTATKTTIGATRTGPRTGTGTDSKTGTRRRK